MNQLETIIRNIRPVDPAWIERARRKQLELTKPPGSLGRLEEIANRCAAIRETLTPTASNARIVLFAADHGVAGEGVSAYPREVTVQMVANFLAGGAGINSLASAGGITLDVVDAGVATPIPPLPGLISRPVAPGTRNFCQEPAMSEAEVRTAIGIGVEMAIRVAGDGVDIAGFGEMGIGNTTSASAIAAALTGQDVDAVVGRGTVVDDAGLARKRSAVARALALHASSLGTALGVLRCVGGLEIAAMAGFVLGAASQRIPVFTDGFIATAAAAAAAGICPDVRDYLFAAHRSAEPGHAHLLRLLGLEPILTFDMRLGEGSGAALAIPIARAAITAFTGMATFESAGVSDR
jgi:nicotinate-nucleotide--dimethylbenzimidazole phosphoribosyltransferase